MTTPTPERWTAETEELVARALESPCVCHFVDIGVGYQKAAEDPTCPRCTLFGQTAAILTALADASVLIAPEGETRQEWGVADVPDHPTEVWPLESEDRARIRAASSRSVDGKLYCRTITTHVGPWREVTDDPT